MLYSKSYTFSLGDYLSYKIQKFVVPAVEQFFVKTLCYD